MRRFSFALLPLIFLCFNGCFGHPIPDNSTETSDEPKEFDYLVIGGGSGGVASAIKAAEYNATVGIIESVHLGGTCINNGCVPKKVMYYAAMHKDFIRDHKDYGFNITLNGFDWNTMLKKRQNYTHGLQDIYKSKLKKAGVTLIWGQASFDEDGSVLVNGTKYKAKHITIATGGRAVIPDGIPGADLGSTINGFFKLTELPKKVVLVIDDAFIGIGLAGILGELGSEVHLLIEHDRVLYNYDETISQNLTTMIEQSGHTKLYKNSKVEKVEKDKDGTLTVFTNQGNIEKVNKLIWVPPRRPMVEDLNLDKAGIKLDGNGFIEVDEKQNTNVKGIYAVGDVSSSKFHLTPVAIAAGRTLARRLFNNEEDSKLIYENIPSAIYTFPTFATVGLSEKDAIEKYGKEELTVYKKEFAPMHFAMTKHKEKIIMKLICTGEDEKIVGLHILGQGADDMLQGFAVAIKMGAKKSDLDNTVGMHPTAVEELVTMKDGHTPPRPREFVF